MAITVRAQ